MAGKADDKIAQARKVVAEADEWEWARRPGRYIIEADKWREMHEQALPLIDGLLEAQLLAQELRRYVAESDGVPPEVMERLSKIDAAIAAVTDLMFQGQAVLLVLQDAPASEGQGDRRDPSRDAAPEPAASRLH